MNVQTNDTDVLENGMSVSAKADVNSSGISKLCGDVQEYVEAIDSVLNSINDVVEGCSSFYSSDTFSNFVEKQENLQLSKKNILENVNSYIDDYNFVLSKFKSNDLNISITNIEKNNN